MCSIMRNAIARVIYVTDRNSQLYFPCAKNVKRKNKQE